MATDLRPEVLEVLGRLFDENPDPVRLVGADGEVMLRNSAARAFPPEGLGHLCPEERRGHDASCPACGLTRVLREGHHRRWHVVLPSSDRAAPATYYEVDLCPVREADGTTSAVVEVLRDATMTLGLEQYLIRTAESQENEIRERTLEAGSLLEKAETLRQELGDLRDSQTELVYRDRLVALGHLVAGLAHEIRTPLGAVVSGIDVLRRHLARLGDPLRGAEATGASGGPRGRLEDMESSAAVVAEGARRIQGVVRSLQLFSRVDEALRKEVDLREGLDSTLELLGYRIGEGIRVVRDYADVPRVTCRPDALNQVFLNLLVNAVQAIPGRGEIRVAVRRDEASVAVEIADDGVGIPPEILPRIFDLGFTTRGHGRGSGIGLALSRWIVEEHGGTLDVKSAPGKGSVFTLRLPVSPPEVSS